MKTRKPLATLFVSLVLAALVAPAAFWGYRRLHPSSLAAWVDQVARPDYKPRYRSRTRSHFVAIFQVGPDTLAFCRKRIDGQQGAPEPKVTITDVEGNSLVDEDRQREVLYRVWDLGVADYEVDDGELIPIRPGFQGRMRIVFDVEEAQRSEEARAADPYRLGVLDVHIRWGGGDQQNDFRGANHGGSTRSSGRFRTTP